MYNRADPTRLRPRDTKDKRAHGFETLTRPYAPLGLTRPHSSFDGPRFCSFGISAETLLAAHSGSPLVDIELTPQLRQLPVTGNKYSALRRNPFFLSASTTLHI